MKQDLAKFQESQFVDRGFSYPERLISTESLAQNLENPDVIILESNEDPLLYRARHIPGAVEVDWIRDLNDPVRRDYLDVSKMSQLLSRIGWTENKCIVLYGDRFNWWATFSMWVFELFGVKNIKILDGGSSKWEQEARPLDKNIPKMESTSVSLSGRDDVSIRAFRDEVLRHQSNNGALIDVRSPAEFSGEKLHMEDYPNEGALRGGHIPGARNIPWSLAINAENGTFKSASQLNELYLTSNKYSPEQDIIVYCRIGERSSHTWFVLSYLLGFKKVRNYDGSWTEYGNLVNVPIERL